MPFRIYIDGHVGTTGLRIRDWLDSRGDLEILSVPENRRKEALARRECLAAADLAVLCLPDGAAREAAAWALESGTRVIDASTAHRVAEGWIYGLPELSPEHRASIAAASRVANPGCYSSAFILLVRPLILAGLVEADGPVVVDALSGYSGGGREMIERWEDPRGALVGLPFEAPYALERVHKHVPEMVRYGSLRIEPQFTPAVGPFRCGMRVHVPLHASLLRGVGGARVWEVLHDRYAAERFVRVLPLCESPVGDLDLDPRSCNGTNRVELRVVPHPSGHVSLFAILDNLGKGAAGVAIQNLNLMLGLPEDLGLTV